MNTSSLIMPLMALLITGWLLGACTTARDDQPFLPRYGADTASVAVTSIIEVRQLQLVATSLVASLMQLPSMDPVQRTLQVSRPSTAFGNLLLRALEDAGYGLQFVSADQGVYYVSYSRRQAATDAGPVTDFTLAVGDLSLQREFIVDGDAIFPSSLLQIDGVTVPESLDLEDSIFREQGASGRQFISGVRDTEGQVGNDSSPQPGSATSLVEQGSGNVGGPAIREVAVQSFDALPIEQRTAQQAVLNEARLHARMAGSHRQSAPDERKYQRLRRTVLILDDPSSDRLGEANKQAIRLMLRDRAPDDRFVITACTDADGQNKLANLRALRVEAELLSYGIASEALWLSPCVRASFRHASDTSPVPVEVVQHRRKTR